MKKILIAVDYDPSAHKVAAYGYRVAKAMNLQPLILHVAIDAGDDFSLNYSPILGFGFFSNEDLVERDRTAEIKRMAFKFLDEIKTGLDDPGIETIVDHGDSAENIILIAEERQVDLIVLGRHSESENTNNVLGNVAAKVIAKSQMPVIVIPT